MKKLFIIIVAISVIFCLVGCKDKMSPKAGDPVLKGIDFKSYDAFAVIKDSSAGSKGLAGSVGDSIGRLFGLTAGELEKITITDDKGLEWACNNVKSIDNAYLLIALSHQEGEPQYKRYLIDMVDNKTIDLSFLGGASPSDLNEVGLQSTKEGLFARKDGAVCKIDIASELLTPLTNAAVDAVKSYYRFNGGAMLVSTDSGTKYFPAHGSPVAYHGGVPATNENAISNAILGAANRAPSVCLTAPGLDFIVNVADKRLIRITPTGLTAEPLLGNCSFPYGIQLYPYERQGASNLTKVIHYIDGSPSFQECLITINDISSGELVYTEYKAPTVSGQKAWHDDCFLYSDSGGIHSFNPATQTDTLIVSGSIHSWRMSVDGLLYTRYLNNSPTDVQNCHFSFSTGTEEVLSSSGVEVVSIASFVN